MRRGYYVSAKTRTAKAVTWAITYRTSRGSDVAAGTVTRDFHSGYYDVRTDAGEPCPVGSFPYRVRRTAVTDYEKSQAQPNQE